MNQPRAFEGALLMPNAGPVPPGTAAVCSVIGDARYTGQPLT